MRSPAALKSTAVTLESYPPQLSSCAHGRVGSGQRPASPGHGQPVHPHAILRKQRQAVAGWVRAHLQLHPRGGLPLEPVDVHRGVVAAAGGRPDACIASQRVRETHSRAGPCMTRAVLYAPLPPSHPQQRSPRHNVVAAGLDGAAQHGPRRGQRQLLLLSLAPLRQLPVAAAVVVGGQQVAARVKPQRLHLRCVDTASDVRQRGRACRGRRCQPLGRHARPGIPLLLLYQASRPQTPNHTLSPPTHPPTVLSIGPSTRLVGAADALSPSVNRVMRRPAAHANKRPPGATVRCVTQWPRDPGLRCGQQRAWMESTLCCAGSGSGSGLQASQASWPPGLQGAGPAHGDCRHIQAGRPAGCTHRVPAPCLAAPAHLSGSSESTGSSCTQVPRATFQMRARPSSPTLTRLRLQAGRKGREGLEWRQAAAREGLLPPLQCDSSSSA